MDLVVLVPWFLNHPKHCCEIQWLVVFNSFIVIGNSQCDTFFITVFLLIITLFSLSAIWIILILKNQFSLLNFSASQESVWPNHKVNYFKEFDSYGDWEVAKSYVLEQVGNHGYHFTYLFLCRLLSLYSQFIPYFFQSFQIQPCFFLSFHYAKSGVYRDCSAFIEELLQTQVKNIILFVHRCV